jgi:hypothetical protein
MGLANEIQELVAGEKKVSFLATASTDRFRGGLGRGRG